MATKQKKEINTDKIDFNFDLLSSPLAASFELNAKQLKFAEEYIATRGDIVVAAKACDMKPQACYALLRNEKIARYIRLRIEQLEKKPDIKASKDEVIQEMAQIAFSDMKDYMSWGTNYITLRDSNTLPPGASKAVSEIIFVENEYGNLHNRRINRQVRIRLHDKKAALDSLARMLGMFETDKKDANAEDVSTKLRKFQYETSLGAAIPKPEDYFDESDTTTEPEDNRPLH